MEHIKKNTISYLWHQITNEMRVFVSLPKVHTRQTLQNSVEQVCTGGYLIKYRRFTPLPVGKATSDVNRHQLT